MKNSESIVCRWMVGMLTFGISLPALAQPAPAAPPPPAAPPAAPPPVAPAPAAPPPAAAPVAPAPEPAPAPVAEPAPVEPMPALVPAPPPLESEAAPGPVGQQTPGLEPPPPLVKVGIGARVGFQFHNVGDEESLSDQNVDVLDGEFRFSGRVHELVGYTANLIGSGKPSLSEAEGLAFEARVLDLIAEFDFADPFHIWVGNMVVPFDRSDLSGAWGLAAWNYPAVSIPFYVGNAFGRDVGATVWGDINEGMFKYHLAVLNLDENEERPTYTARLMLNLLDGEPGYYNASTYYGDKNIIAIGAGVQHQVDGSTVAGETDDRTSFTADLLGEYNIAGAGTITGEAGYYHLSGVTEDDALFVLGAFLIEPPLGIGQIQPVVRYQTYMPEDEDDDTSALDLFANYVIAKSALRVSAGFQHAWSGDEKANRIQIGVQVQQ